MLQHVGLTSDQLPVQNAPHDNDWITGMILAEGLCAWLSFHDSTFQEASLELEALAKSLLECDSSKIEPCADTSRAGL